MNPELTSFPSWTRTEQNDHLDFSPSLPYYLAMGASYLGGLVIYTSKWPEKCKPGKFDIFVIFQNSTFL